MNLFWAILVAVLAIYVQALVFGKMAARKLTCNRHLSRKAVFAGETLELTEVLKNTGLLPVPWVCVESRISADIHFLQSKDQRIVRDQYHRSYFYAPHRTQITRRHTLQCLNRGYYDLSSITFTTGDLMGMVRRAQTLDMHLYISVYPRLLKSDDLPSEALRWQGEILTRRWVEPDPFQYKGIREYMRGDPMKAVHWRASASAGQLMVRQYEYTSSPKAIILLNIQPNPQLWGEISQEDKPLMEYALSLCATIALTALSVGAETGMACNGRLPSGYDSFIGPGAGDAQRARLLEYLARVQIGRATNFHTFLQELRPRLYGQDILIITAYQDEQMIKAMDALREQHNRISLLTDWTARRQAG